MPAVAEPFDAKVHHLEDEKATVPAQGRIAETVATGYTYQGQLLRPALVTLQMPAAAEAAAAQAKPVEGQLL